MNPQDVPPKPASPPTAGIPRVDAAPAPASVTWPPQHAEAGPSTSGASESAPSGATASHRAHRAKALWKALFAVVLIAVVGGLVWLALWLNSGAASPEAQGGQAGVLETTPTPRATPLPLPREGVKPADYAVGDCFKDFDPESLASTAVPCDTGHSAQLVATLHYPDSAKYPGADPLKVKALEVCQAAKLGPAAKQFQLNYQRSFPSNTSWESGDRRVDCYITADGGNVINASVQPRRPNRPGSRPPALQAG